MHRDKWFVLTAVVLLSTASCRAPDSPPAAEPAAESRGERHVSAQQVALLEESVRLDRQMLEIAEQKLASLRKQHRAGRLAGIELVPAERDVIRCKQTLLIRECELSDARLGASDERRVVLLEALVDLDRRAVDLAVLEQAQEQQLFDAGRRQKADLVAAESSVLRCKQVLLSRRRELADAQEAARS